MRAKPLSEFAEIAVEIAAETSPRFPPRSRRDCRRDLAEMTCTKRSRSTAAESAPFGMKWNMNDVGDGMGCVSK